MSEDEVSLRNELYYIGKCNTMIYNICTSPKSDYENTPLKEHFQEDLEYDKAMAEKLENSAEGTWVPLEIEYFLFDFNADGLEDYVVCVTGSNEILRYDPQAERYKFEKFWDWD